MKYGKRLQLVESQLEVCFSFNYLKNKRELRETDRIN